MVLAQLTPERTAPRGPDTARLRARPPDGRLLPLARSQPERTAPPVALVIFGASGDLTHRKLTPALFDLFQAGLLARHVVVLGVARSPLTEQAFRDAARQGVRDHSARLDFPQDTWHDFSARLHYVQGAL